MQRIASALQRVCIVFVLCIVGCTAPAFLMNPPAPSEQEEMTQALSAINTWNGRHISKVIQKWGEPHGVTNDEADLRIYVYQLRLPVREFFTDPGVAERPTRIHPRSSRSGAAGIHPVSMDSLYELTFYTDSKGVIQKTLLKESAASDFSRPPTR